MVVGVSETIQRADATALVADDDEQSARLLVRILEHGGFGNVVSTTDSTQVITLCSDLEPHILLLDVSMPSPNGFEILEALRESDARSPAVVVLTGHEHPSIERQALELGAVAVLRKTGSRELLLERVDSALDNQSAKKGSDI